MPIPKWVVTAGLMAAQVALGMSRKIQGPRLENTKVTVAEYGTPIPRFWGIRKFEAPMPHAEEITVRKKKSKTKGGKYSEDRGFGTWMSLICDHEIDAVTRIWFDDRLIYDATGGGPISAGSFLSGLNGGGVSLGSNMRVYLGTEDQLPDPRYEAWCEDRYGADSAPAYRGSAYVFFEDVPLANFGNRIPNVTIEAVSNKSDIYPTEVTASVIAISWASFSPDGSRMLLAQQNGMFEIWDTVTRQIIRYGENGPFFTGKAAIANSGDIYTAVAGDFYRSNPDLTSWVELDNPDGADGNSAFNCAGSIWISPYFDSRTYAVRATTSAVAKVEIGYWPSHFFADLDDNVWAVGPGTGVCEFYCVQGTEEGTSYSVATGSSSDAFGVVNAAGEAVIFQGAVTARVDLSDGSILDTASIGADVIPISALLPGATRIWVNNSEYSLTDLSLIRSINPANWGYPAESCDLYVPSLHALIDQINSPNNDLRWLFLDRVSNAGVTLQTIVDDVSEWCGFTSADTSALTQTVLGYSVSQGTGKDMIAPLLDIHDVDARPHDDGLQFLVRGSASGGTLLTTNFVREGDSPRYTVTVQQDTDLPRRVTVNFADANADQQVNTSISQRPLDAVDSNRDETIDLSTYVADPDTAQQLSDRRHRRLWNERETIKLSLTAQNMSLEPGDVRTLSLDGSERIARLDKVTLKGSVLDCEWIRDHPTLHNLNGATGAELEGRNPETIYIPAQTRGIVIDAPLASDADNDINPVIYLAAGSYGGTWPGAQAYRGEDGSYDELFAQFDESATWGYAEEALATANPNLWDRGNTLDVSIFGTLTSSTESAINDDPSVNLMAIGLDGRWEYLNFVTATLTGTSGEANLYTLSGFKRGRRGTEANVGNHAAGDTIVLLSGVAPVEVGTDEIGNDMSFRIQTMGRDIDAAPANDLTFTAATLKPYAPHRLEWTTDGTDLFGEITRRTRIGSTWTDDGVVPLGENSEAYEVDVMDGADVVRTITVTGTNTFTYTAAQISADGFTVASPPDVNVYQMSDAVGRGFALAA